MTHIEKLHLPHSKTWDCYNDEPLKENHALKSAEITKTSKMDRTYEFILKPKYLA